MSDIQTDANASRSSYELEDETSEDEILPPGIFKMLFML
jgi:hypothetical protein